MSQSHITDDLEKTRKLLNEVFPSTTKFEDQNFLFWEYFASPSGTVIQTNLDLENDRLGHYALVPQRWILGGEEMNVALSLNTAISQNHRMKGKFLQLAEDTFSSARDNGIDAIVGVANENSTWAFVKRMGFEHLGSLETKVVFRKSFNISSFAKQLSNSDLDTYLQFNDANLGEENGFHRIWDELELKWRLSSPGANYESYLIKNAVVIVLKTKFKGISVSMILKVIANKEHKSLGMQEIVNDVCKMQNTKFAVYSGFNPSVRSQGVFIPNWLRPAPLNLILKPLSRRFELIKRNPTTFEFLDFDAY